MSNVGSVSWEHVQRCMGVQMSANSMMDQPLQQQTAPNSVQSTLNVFTGKPCNCGHGGWCNCPQAPKLPYLVVPRDAQPAPLVRTEVEILREQLEAMKAQIAALTPPASPVPNSMTRAISRWPGSQGFIQGIRWRGSL